MTDGTDAIKHEAWQQEARVIAYELNTWRAEAGISDTPLWRPIVPVEEEAGDGKANEGTSDG